MSSVDVVLPALDEADAIPGVLASMPPGYRPIVVDNGSSDATAMVAAELGALVVREEARGFGAACYAGLVAAEAEVVCFMDADGSFDSAQLHSVADPVLEGSCDLVLGARRAAPGSWPWHLRFANRVLALELRRRTGLEPATSGRCVRRGARLCSHSAWWTAARAGPSRWCRSRAAGWRIGEVEVDYRPRIGSSKVTGTIGGMVRAVRDMGRHLSAH
ncbi:MAG: glycosyltransferase family 2 protein [Microthrixaceae bacterium]